MDEFKTKLVRYTVVDGVRTLRDSQVAMLFQKAKEDGVLELAMYSDNVEEMTPQGFVDYYKNSSRLLWLVLYEGKLAGWVWLDDLGHRTARIHFCFFKWLTKARSTIRVARELLWQLLDIEFRGGAKLRAIRGETPAFNRLAVRFIQKVGLRVVGEMPYAAYRRADDTSYPMVYSFITKEILEEVFASEAAPAPAGTPPAGGWPATRPWRPGLPGRRAPAGAA